MRRLQTLFAAFAIAAALAAPSALVAATEVERARELATGGQRDEAIRLLYYQLSVDPMDTEARTLLGTVLSWDGRYDDARTQLDAVLATNPTHGDALPALINVELWSGHPDRAESLAATGLAASPDDVTLLNAHARALYAMGRGKEALQDCERVLALDPNNTVARDLRERIRTSKSLWKVAGIYTYDHLSPDDQDWHETQFYVNRQMAFGSLIGRWSHAWRFGLNDDQFEVEAYPRVRPGSYFWVDAGFSPQHDLYPKYRLAFDFYQSLPAGFEFSVGYRRLGFDDAVDIYVGSISNYWRSWMFTGRVYITPGDAGSSTSASYSLAARQYFGEGLAYYGFRYGWGSPGEIRDITQLSILDSQTFAAEVAWPLPRGFEIDATLTYADEEHVIPSTGGVRPVDHYTASVGLYYSF